MSDVKVSGDVCAHELGVGQPTVCAVKKMLGYSGARKVFVKPIRDFLRRYPDFKLSDARDREAMENFARRHPKYHLPEVEDQRRAA